MKFNMSKYPSSSQKEEVEETKEKFPLFEVLFKILNVIKKPNSYKDYKNYINGLLKNTKKSDLNSLIYFLQKFLVYNNFTRQTIPMFFNVRSLLGDIEYIYFLVDFSKENKLKWDYKTDYYNTKTKSMIKKLQEKLELSDDDFELFRYEFPFLSSKDLNYLMVNNYI